MLTPLARLVMKTMLLNKTAMNKHKFILLENHVDLPFSCVSFFLDIGMKDDTIQGISHLIEHIIIEELMKSFPDLFQNNRIDAYVDKEFTCFHAMVLSENINKILFAFSHLFDCMNDELSREIIEAQKDIIFEIENERVLSNPQLINILLLERLAFSGKLKKTTIVNREFLFLDENGIKEFYKNNYLTSTKHLILSGDISNLNIEMLFESNELIHTPKNSIISGDNEKEYCIPVDNFDDLMEIKKIVAITINNPKCSIEYYTLHIICLFYKVLINNILKNTECYVKDITFKLYSEETIIFFHYNKYYDGTLQILQNIEVDNCEDMFLKIKKHFLYGYLQKSCNLLDFNKEIYKLFRFFCEKIDYKNIVNLINGVGINDVVAMHQKILNGNYICVE